MEKNIFTPFPEITTERLILRQLSINDDKELFILRSDGIVNTFLDRAKTISIENARSFIHKITDDINKNKVIYWAITLKNIDKLIGTICYFNISDENNKAEIGYELLSDFHRKGMMQETMLKIIEFGFQNMGLHTIEAFTHRDNESSIKLLEKFKFIKQRNPGSTTDKKLIVLKLTNTQ